MLNLPRRFLRLPVIIDVLPYNIVNGTLANADEVMANFNYIVDQVNANAQPGGGAATADLEWALLPDAGTFVSTTSFTMTGDQTAYFPIGRRVRSVNTGGTVYSTVVSAVVVLNTTVTVVNTSGVLDSGLSAVSIGTLSPVDPSSPLYSDLITPQESTLLPASSITLLSPTAVPVGDELGEWATGRFTPRVAGTYVVRADGYLLAGAVNLTILQFFNMILYKNGVLNTTFSQLNWPFASGVQDNKAPLAGAMAVSLIVGDYIDVRIQSDAYSGGLMFWTGNISVRRLPTT